LDLRSTRTSRTSAVRGWHVSSASAATLRWLIGFVTVVPGGLT
jgi:hypothetical protein